MLIVPPRLFSELLPLFCRSLSRLVKNDCNAADPEVVAEVVPAVEVAAGVALAAVLPVAVALAEVLPPSALISCVKALLRFEIAPADRLDPVVLVTI